MATPNLNLTLPTPTVTLGPAWANEVNAAFEVIDSHDHTSGKGARIPTAGLNINADLQFNEFGILNARLVSLQERTSSPSGSDFASSISIFNGDLYFTNSSGVAVQVTSGGSIVSSPGNAQVFETFEVSSDLIISPAASFVYLITDTSAARNITLPLASAVTAGRIYIIKDITGQSNANNITLTAAGSDLVDSAATATLNSNFGSTMVISDGVSNWYIS